MSWKHATVWSLDVLSPGFSHCSCWCFRNLADICWLENSSAYSLKLSTHLHFSNQKKLPPTNKNLNHLNFPTTFSPFFETNLWKKALLWSMSPVHQAWVPYPTSVGHGHVNVHHPPRLSLWWWESWPHALQKPPGHDATEKGEIFCRIWRSITWLRLVAQNSINVDPIKTKQSKAHQAPPLEITVVLSQSWCNFKPSWSQMHGKQTKAKPLKKQIGGWWELSDGSSEGRLGNLQKHNSK